MPEAPQVNAYVNAFTPAAVPQEAQPQNPMAQNAFSNMNPQPNAMAMAPQYPQAPGYGPNPYQPNPYQPNPYQQNPYPQTAYSQPPYQPNPMAQGYPMAPGYPPNPNMMMVQGAPNPYANGPQGAMGQQASMQRPMMQQPMMQQPMAQQPMMQQPAMQQPMMMSPNRSVVATGYPQNYQPGFQAPNPYAAPMQQPSLQQNPVQPVQYASVGMQQPANNPAMDRHVVSAAGGASPEVMQIMQVLRESPYPAQREWASNTLSTYDCAPTRKSFRSSSAALAEPGRHRPCELCL